MDPMEKLFSFCSCHCDRNCDCWKKGNVAAVAAAVVDRSTDSYEAAFFELQQFLLRRDE
jgi:hypothetical protein